MPSPSISSCSSRGLGVLGAAATLLVTACGGGDDDDTNPPAPADYTLTLVHINDQHSTLDSKSRTLKLNTGGATPATVTVDAAGFPRVTQAIEDIAKAAGPNVLKIHAGDALTGTLYFNRAGADGEADAAMMNTVGCGQLLGESPSEPTPRVTTSRT